MKYLVLLLVFMTAGSPAAQPPDPLTQLAQAEAHLSARQFESARQLFEAAIQFAIPADHRTRSLSLRGLGRCESALGNFDLADSRFNSALLEAGMLEGGEDLRADNLFSIATSLILRHESRGRFDKKSIESTLTALLTQAQKNIPLRKRFVAVYNAASLASLLGATAQEGMLRDKLVALAEEDPKTLMVDALFGRATHRQRNGNIQMAAYDLQLALAAADRYHFSKSRLAQLHSAIGSVELHRKQPRRAIASLQKALALAPDAPAPSIVQWEDLLALAHQEAMDFQASKQHYDRAFAAWGNQPDSPQLIGLLHNRGVLAEVQGQLRVAEQYFLRAHAQLATVKNHHRYSANIPFALGMLYARRGQPAKAVEFLRQATRVRSFEFARALLRGDEDEKLKLIDARRDLNDYIHAYAAGVFPGNAAFAQLALENSAAESMQVRQSFTRIANWLDHRQSVPPSLLARVDAARSHMASQEPLKMTFLEELRALERELADAHHPLVQPVLPLPGATIVQAVPAHGALIQYFRYRRLAQADPDINARLREDRYGAVVTLNGFVRALDLGEAAAIDTLVADFTLRLRSRRPEYQAAGTALYDRLIRPLRLPGHVRGLTLFIVPDGALHLLPFAGLMPHSGGFLIERHPVLLLDSAAELVAAKRAPFLGALRTANAFVDPAYPEGIDALPGGQIEADTVTKVLSRENVSIYSGTSATKDAFLKSAPADLLLLSLHAIFGSLQPYIRVPVPTRYSAALLFSPPAGSSLGGALLTARELSFVSMGSYQLLILGGCQTADGELLDAEAIAGIRRAVHAAGARRVIANLWDANDAAFSNLVASVLPRIAKPGQLPNAALHLAAYQKQQAELGVHPQLWAGTVLVGY